MDETKRVLAFRGVTRSFSAATRYKTVKAPTTVPRKQAYTQECTRLASAVILSPTLPSFSDGDTSAGVQRSHEYNSSVVVL